jgi:vacuolar-type H+-ATPase subunit H
MHMMKKSLLQQVERIEKEASGIIHGAQEQTAQELTRVTEHIENAHTSLREKAEQTSASIMNEYKEKGKKEAEQILNQSQHSANTVHATGEQNRSRGIEKAKMLFAQEYKTTLE